MNIKHKTIVMTALLITTLTILPITSFAQGNNKGHDKNEQKKELKREEKNEKKNEKSKKDNDDKKSCLRAVGHFIAPGWIKHHGTITIDENCWFHFDFFKRKGGTGTTSPDVIAPVISSLLSNQVKNNIVVRWTTDEKSDSSIFYSTISPFNASASSTLTVKKNNDSTKTHEITLKNLATSTPYFAVVRSRDASGNVATSSVITFTKLPIADTTAPNISNIINIVGTSTLKVDWTTNEPATSKIFYSTTNPVNVSATTTPFIQNSSLTLGHSLTITGLSTSTQYFLVLQSTDGNNNTRTSPQYSLTTGI